MVLDTAGTAARLYNRTCGREAWNLTDDERRAVKRHTRNAYGATSTFADESVAFVPKGTATVIVRRLEGGDHALSDFDAHLPDIVDFLGLQPDPR